MKTASLQKGLIVSLIASAITGCLFSALEATSLEISLSRLGAIITFFYLSAVLVLLMSGINRCASKLYFSFLIIFGLFHLGVPMGAMLSEFTEGQLEYIDRWYFSGYTEEAIIAVFVFLVGYFIAYILPIKAKVSRVSDFYILRDEHFNYGTYLLFILVAIWVLVVKIIYSVDTYSEYYESAENPFLIVIYKYFHALIGFTFVLLVFSDRYRKRAILIFSVWAVFAFPMGLRGSVLFPLAIAVPILVVNKFIKVTYLHAAIGLITLLMSISFISNYRVQGEIIDRSAVNPVGAIVEMGGTLRPVFEVMKWIDEGQSSYLLGQTYWAPFERTLAKGVPFYSVPDALDDTRLMNVMILKNAGPYGFSIVAEAFINYGWIGVFFVGLTVGVILIRLDYRLISPTLMQYSFIDLCVASAIFFHVRQSFVGAYGVFALGFILCATIAFVYKVKKTKKLAQVNIGDI